MCLTRFCIWYWLGREEPEPDAEDQLSAFDEELQNLHLGGAVSSASDSESDDDSSDGYDGNAISESGRRFTPDRLGHDHELHASDNNGIDGGHIDSGDFQVDADCPADVNWQAVIDNLFKPKWPNANWTLLSRLLNIIGSTDRDSDVLLDTIRQLDWTASIPSNVAELRKVETEALGSNE